MTIVAGFEVKPLSRKQIKALKKGGSEATRATLTQLSQGSDVELEQFEDVMDDFFEEAFPGQQEKIDGLPYGEAVALFTAIMGATFAGAEVAEKN